MTQQLSVQYSTMQISFIHIMLNIHIVFQEQNATESTIIKKQQKKKEVLSNLLNRLYRLRHSIMLSPPIDTQTSLYA